ncbi:Threonine aldolase [Serendipita sp. 401]|nr:Threonine aldolase [Serendipita sp. 401]KAG8835689.1 Threonine aldolase [Serendipita sp. 400]KAG9055034.1 Threonine aldolase [Serendipita sp. 407]
MSNKTLSDAQRAIIDGAKLDLMEHSPNRISQDAERRSLARNFCSDTVTAPSAEMLKFAMKATSVGDDVFGWDYCTNALEQHMAKICGKEAAIFVSSGTMGNQIALRCLFERPPYSVVCDHRSHIYKYEAGGAAFHSGAATIAVVPKDERYISLEDVKEHAITTDDIHYATTRVIALENTLNGTIHPQSSILEISRFAREHRMKMHLDGARLWHVSVETGLSLEELCKPFDTISLCFSKGLGTPAGSILVGPSDLITLARRYRKLFGGGMRQTGILSACAAYALNHHIALLPSVHSKAKRLADGLSKIGVEITEPTETCMVWFDPSSVGLTTHQIGKRAAQLEQPIMIFESNRLVVHIQTSDEAIDDFLNLVQAMAEEHKGGKLRVDGTSRSTHYPARL